jgi:hypothetical protein
MVIGVRFRVAREGVAERNLLCNILLKRESRKTTQVKKDQDGKKTAEGETKGIFH